jgi:hypothetical protein
MRVIALEDGAPRAENQDAVEIRNAAETVSDGDECRSGEMLCSEA